MCSSNSSLTATVSPHLLRVNNWVVTAKVLPKVQPSSSPWEVETSKVWGKRSWVMYGGMFTALVGSTQMEKRCTVGDLCNAMRERVLSHVSSSQ